MGRQSRAEGCGRNGPTVVLWKTCGGLRPNITGLLGFPICRWESSFVSRRRSMSCHERPVMTIGKTRCLVQSGGCAVTSRNAQEEMPQQRGFWQQLRRLTCAYHHSWRVAHSSVKGQNPTNPATVRSCAHAMPKGSTMASPVPSRTIAHRAPGFDTWARTRISPRQRLPASARNSDRLWRGK